MKYLLGFDCGATNIECALADEEGKILHILKRNIPSNLLIEGAENTAKNIFTLTEEIKTIINKSNSLYFEKVVVGAAGAGRKSDAHSLLSELAGLFKCESVFYQNMMVVSDAHIALEAAFPSQAGSILIAGTGSIIYSKDEDGNIYRAGGFGRLIGDAGSGYSIASRTLKQAAMDFDTGNDNSNAVLFLSDNYQVRSLDGLLTELYKNDFDIASVAKQVIDSAQQGNDFAQKILDKESDELVILIKTLMKKMKADKIEISLSGSLIDNKNYYSDQLKEKINLQLKNVKVIEKKYRPVEGAIILAKGMPDG